MDHSDAALQTVTGDGWEAFYSSGAKERGEPLPDREAAVAAYYQQRLEAEERATAERAHTAAGARAYDGGDVDDDDADAGWHAHDGGYDGCEYEYAPRGDGDGGAEENGDDLNLAAEDEEEEDPTEAVAVAVADEAADEEAALAAAEALEEAEVRIERVSWWKDRRRL